MATILTHAENLNDSNPSVVTHNSTRSVTVAAHVGDVAVQLGALSGGSMIVKEGTTASWSVFGSFDSLEPATITAAPGGEALVIWTRL